MSRNIVMEAHLIRPAHFTGMTCTAFERRESSGAGGLDVIESTHDQQLHFRCTTGTHNISLNAFPLKVKQEKKIRNKGKCLKSILKYILILICPFFKECCSTCVGLSASVAVSSERSHRM